MSRPIDDFVGALLERRKDAPTSEGDREFFLTEIRVLKEKLNLAELRVEELVAKNAELSSTLGSQKMDQADIFEYLNGELAKKTQEVVRLEEGIQSFEENNAHLIAEYETKLTTSEDAHSADREQLEKQIGELTAALEELSDFRARKDELERDSAQVKATLDDEKREHQRHVSELERKHVQEKDRLKKEMLVKLRETKATLHKMTANQLDATTKRTIAENEQISSELAWQSKETDKLIRRNEKLTDEAKTLRRELELHKQTEEEFARKVHVYQKTIKTLLAKLNSMDLAKRSDTETLQHVEEEIERARALAHSQIESLEEEAARLRIGKGSAESEVEQLREEIERAHALAEQRESIVDDGVRFLLECLDDARSELPRLRSAIPIGAEASGTGGVASASVLGGGGSPSTHLEDEDSALVEFDGAQPDLSALSAQPSQLADLREPGQREAVLGSMLERLQAYQKQLAELAMHREWRAIQRHALEQRREGHDGVVPLPPIGMPPSAVAHGGALPASEIAPGVPMLMPDPFAFGPGLAAVPGRPAGGARAKADAFSLRSSSALESGVHGPVRPWGKRSKELPLSARHGPGTLPRASLASSSAV
ncbi:hypothetical protein KFE25_009917 [Diacronema lutheri]|uniref:Cilia- and flagella-associated protein 157 n=1 Tax=Diacronema lutheri TaxID=2081491 RepID=A0A8J5XJ54_DIALT|nr:hypothetical protein KFE25_009917 [Diacronema lutheri]